MKKKVCVVIGSRANYSSAKSIMKAIQQHDKLELQVALGAAALLDRFGNLEDTLTADGFPIHTKFYMIVEGENPVTMAKSTGVGIQELATTFDNLVPDLVLVIGDRFDVMATVIAATYMNIPIAHTMGGERSGTIDESIRHAITKFSHLHFPANEDARERIIKMGEDPATVFNVGCPRTDYVLECLKEPEDEDPLNGKPVTDVFGGVGGTFNIEEGKFLLASYHPVTTEYGSNKAQMDEVLESLLCLQMPTIMIWPNADAGSDEVSKSIRIFREEGNHDWLHLYINLPADVYFRLIKICACMVGNSSSAIREGEAIGVPAVNIGSRQNMRLKGANVVDVPPDREQIVAAVKAQIEHGPFESKFLYGDGTAGPQIAEILSRTDFSTTQKVNYY
jgi:UDP-hydrolysing UDP-N-acetyl-D-glucosamine 2-epimerase